MDLMSIVIWIVLGAIAGVIASFIMGTRSGIVMDIIVGIIGAFIGGFLLSLLGINNQVGGLNWLSILTAVIGAIVLLAVMRLARRSSTA